MTRDDVPLGKGQCDIRLQVDNQVEVSVRGDMVHIRTQAGRDAYDDGNSECNAPLPDREVPGFRFEVLERRGDIQLLAEPSRRNNYSAIVAIRDGQGGMGRYHFRLSWQMTGSDYRPGNDRPGFGHGGRPEGPPGFAWNNTINFRGNGRGAASLNDFGQQRLGDCTVDIDRGGRISVFFRGEHNRDLRFNGSLIGREGGRLKAEVLYEDRRLRGVMFLSVDDRSQQVNAVTFEGGDGRDRMRLNWDRR